MATRKPGAVRAANEAINTVLDEKAEAEYAAAAANPDIVRAAGITNGMPAEEVRRRILAAAGKG